MPEEYEAGLTGVDGGVAGAVAGSTNDAAVDGGGIGAPIEEALGRLLAPAAAVAARAPFVPDEGVVLVARVEDAGAVRRSVVF